MTLYDTFTRILQVGAPEATAETMPALELLLGVALLALAMLWITLAAKARQLRRAQEDVLQLSDSEAHYRSVVDCAHDILFTLDRDGAFTSVNPAVERVTGRDPHSLLRQPIGELAARDEDAVKLHRRVSRVLETGSAASTRIRVTGRDGGDHVLEIGLHPRESEGEVIGVQGSARDITMRVELEKSRLEVEQLEAVGRMSGGIAHDFNNILTIIRGHGEQILESAGAQHPDCIRGLEAILAATRRAELLTLQLMGHSRRHFEPAELLDLNEVVQATMTSLSWVLPEDIEVRTQLDSTGPSVHADRGSLEQILLNLCLNARDAMPDGGELQIETRDVVVEAAGRHEGIEVRPGRYVTLSVADSGTGMDRKVAAHIFEPFFTTKHPGKGTGLGLPTVQSSVNRLGGHITMNSNPGQGTRFTILLPFSDLLPQVAPPAMDLRRAKPAERLLLVEGDPEVRGILHEALVRAGHEIVWVANSEEGLDLPDENLLGVQAMVASLNPGHPSSVDVARRLRRSDPDLPILFLTGYAGQSAPADLEGRVRCIRKPIAPTELIRELRRLCDAPNPSESPLR